VDASAAVLVDASGGRWHGLRRRSVQIGCRAFVMVGPRAVRAVSRRPLAPSCAAFGADRCCARRCLRSSGAGATVADGRIVGRTLVQFATVASVVFLASFVQGSAGSGRVLAVPLMSLSIAPAARW